MHKNKTCSIPDCLNDAMDRIHMELRNDERVWIIERNKSGKWGASVIRDRSASSIHEYLTAGFEDRAARGVREDERYVPYPEEFTTVAHGRGNNVYQALHNLWLELKLYHRDGATTGKRTRQTRTRKG